MKKMHGILSAVFYLLGHQKLGKGGFDGSSEKAFFLLDGAGFDRPVIYSTLHWLRELGEPVVDGAPAAALPSIRVYDETEEEKLSLDSRSFLIKLEQKGVLTLTLREKIIAQLMALGIDEVDIQVTRWVTLCVFCMQPEKASDLAYVERLVARHPVTLQ